jgi:hypothetical protein
MRCILAFASLLLVAATPALALQSEQDPVVRTIEHFLQQRGARKSPVTKIDRRGLAPTSDYLLFRLEDTEVVVLALGVNEAKRDIDDRLKRSSVGYQALEGIGDQAYLLTVSSNYQSNVLFQHGGHVINVSARTARAAEDFARRLSAVLKRGPSN